MKKIIAIKIFIISLILSSLLFLGCGDSEGSDSLDQKDQKVIYVQTQEVKTEPFVDYIALIGTVKPEMMANLASDEGGKIKKYYVEKGSYVNQGDVILEMDNDVLKANMDAAKANYDRAESNFSKQEKIFNQNVSSELQYLNAKYDMEAAKANYDLMKARYDRTFIKAPFSGYFDSKYYEVGETIMPSVPVVSLIKMDRMKIEAGVPENYVNAVKTGDKAKLVFKDLDGYEVYSNISFVGKSISTNNRTFPVEIKLNNPGNKIKPELSVLVYIQRNMFDKAVVIPEEVILKTDMGYVVFVAKDDVAEMRKVDIISRYNNMAAIKSGLDSGDKLITVGFQNLLNGEKIKVVNQD